MPSPTGAHTELWYRWETPSDYGGTVDTSEDKKPFGGNATLSNFEGSNNAVDIFEPNSRKKAQLIEQHFDGAASIDFEVTNPWWLQAVIAAPTTVDNGDGTYTHTFEGDLPHPMRIYAGYEARANDGGSEMYRELKGFIVQSATLSVSVEGTVECSLTGAYIREETDQTSLKGQPPITHDVMTFADATLALDESTLSLVQDASVEINNNTDIKRELGTRFGVDYTPKGFDPSVDFTQIRKDNSQVESMYGEAAASAVQEDVDAEGPMTFGMDQGGSGGNIIDIGMDGAFPETMSTDNLGNPQEDLQESINKRLLDATASATNGVATPP